VNLSFRVQSAPWLLVHEMRLTWRNVLHGPSVSWRLLFVAGVFIISTLVLGVPLAVSLRRVAVPVIGVTVAAGIAILIYLFTLGLSLAIRAATDALYDRGDFDLLFASPISATAVIFVRCGAIAANIFIGSALFVTPFTLPLAVLGHPSWLCAYFVMAAMAATATASGLLLTITLFRTLGPKWTRAAAQILAVLFGAGVFLASQATSIFGHERFQAWLLRSGNVSRTRPWTEDFASWPIRALTGEAGPLIAIVTMSCLLFLVTTLWVGRRFASDAGAAAGGAYTPPGRKELKAFASGLFANTLKKEIRLLGRDITLLTQVFARLFYLLPLTFLLLRNAHGHAMIRLPLGVGLVTLMTGQTIDALVWITVAAEDAPDLIASSPAPPSSIIQAKLAAAVTPLAAVLATPLIVLTLLAPIPGLAATLGCAGVAFANGFVGLRLQKPAQRSAFRRRGTESIAAGVAAFLISLLIAGAAGLMAARSIFGLIPLLIAGAALIAINQL
jgi:ABC-2 type transport system permease protein